MLEVPAGCILPKMPGMSRLLILAGVSGDVELLIFVVRFKSFEAITRFGDEKPSSKLLALFVASEVFELLTGNSPPAPTPRSRTPSKSKILDSLPAFIEGAKSVMLEDWGGKSSNCKLSIPFDAKFESVVIKSVSKSLFDLGHSPSTLVVFVREPISDGERVLIV